MQETSLIPIFSLYFIQKLHGLVNTKSDSYHKVYINHTIATYIPQAKDRISISVIKVKNKETDGGLKQKPDFKPGARRPQAGTRLVS